MKQRMEFGKKSVIFRQYLLRWIRATFLFIDCFYLQL